MAYTTKMMRQKMADDAHEAKHPERAQERIRFCEAAERALAETHDRWPIITLENFAQAIQYREQRIKELLE